jgi:cell division protein FtsW (lipid II flippase)
MDIVAGRVWSDERRPIRHVDWFLIALVLAMVVVGLFLLYSATNQTLRQDRLDPFSRVN